MDADFLNEFKVEMIFKDRCMYTMSGDNVTRNRFLNEVMDGEETRKCPVLHTKNNSVDVPIVRIDPATSAVPAD
jgi:hypothetical protein